MALESSVQESSFWNIPASDVARELETNVQSGLSEQEAVTRLEIFGRNSIEETEKRSGFATLLGQFKSPLILILVAATIVTIVIGHYRDAFFIALAVVVNTALGFYQEFKAENALAELKTYLKLRARVIREGVEHEIDAELLVPGDILRISQGARIPADARLVFVNDLQIDEAVLTGESLPVQKSTDVAPENATLGDQAPMLFAGTLVTQGVGTAIVCRTDDNTELGKIALLVSATEKEETPLQTAIKRFSLRASIVLGTLTIGIFFIGISAGHSLIDMFLTTVAIAVSAIPEGLPVALTVILDVGVQRMARRKGVGRNLVAAEALGSTTVILTDKT